EPDLPIENLRHSPSSRRSGSNSGARDGTAEIAETAERINVEPARLGCYVADPLRSLCSLWFDIRSLRSLRSLRFKPHLTPHRAARSVRRGRSRSSRRRTCPPPEPRGSG